MSGSIETFKEWMLMARDLDRQSDFLTCRPVALPVEELEDAAQTAQTINPANHPDPTGKMEWPRSRIAVLTTKYWGKGGVKLGVTFLDTTDSTLENKILAHMNAWGTRCNAVFMESSQGQVRIARQQGSGYWSYLGTDILHIPTGQATMNLEAFTVNTPESEYLRVVRHETGHTLGCPHEHQRTDIVSLLDPQKTISYFRSHYNWSAQTTQEQVLTPLSEASLMGTPADVQSIMAYQISSSCTKNGQPIPGGLDINESDYAFMASLYPKDPVPPPPPPGIGRRVVLMIDGTVTGVHIVEGG